MALSNHPRTKRPITLRPSRLPVSGTREESAYERFDTASVSAVLVHGRFVDGFGWQGVYKILQQHGYCVGIVQNHRPRSMTTSPSPNV
jgi:hypothetical protein